MILLELSSISHIWVILSIKIAREGEGIEGKGKRRKGGKNHAFSLNLPLYSLQLLFKTLSDASFCAGANAHLRVVWICESSYFDIKKGELGTYDKLIYVARMLRINDEDSNSAISSNPSSVV